MKHIKEIVEDDRVKRAPAMTAGLRFLDENMGGLYPGELTVICGDTNCGKTAVMIDYFSIVFFSSFLLVGLRKKSTFMG